MVEPTIRGGDVALFIDWENFKISLAGGSRSPNLSSLKEEVSNQGRVVVAKAYADWVTRAPELRGASQFINDPPSLYAAGIEPVFVPTRMPSTQASTANGIRTYRVKNSVDVKMTADCIECAHSYPNIGTFVLVSGDSDFLHVVNALRTMGKRVVIIGVSWSTSRRLADQVDSLLLYDKDVDPVAPQPAVLPQHANPPSERQDEVPELPEVIRAIEDIIREERAAGGQPLLTSIKQRMMRRYPNFDEKKLGFSGFKKLMARAAEDGNIKLIHSGLVDWAIMSDEEVPEGTTEEAPAGVTSRPSRRRGGRRRSGQRDADGAADDSEDVGDLQDGDESLHDAEDSDGIHYEDTLEETAATDYALPDAEDGEDDYAVGYEETSATPAEVWPDDHGDAEYADLAASVGAMEPALEDESEQEVEAMEPEPQAEPVAEDHVFGNDDAVANAIRALVESLSLTTSPGDSQDAERVSDLIVMADHLEHRQGIRHVTFTYLVSEVCTALSQGLEAGNQQIADRWGGIGARDYVSQAFRELSQGGLFKRGMIGWRENGERRQRRVINLVRENELVLSLLTARLGPAADMQPPVDGLAEGGAESQDDLPAARAAESVERPQDVPSADAVPVDDAQLVEDAAEQAQPEPDAGEQAQPVAEASAQVVSQEATLNSEVDVEDQERDDDAPPEAADDPQPAAQNSADTAGSGNDEIYDEPQPRSARRRRPFTSRLLSR